MSEPYIFLSARNKILDNLNEKGMLIGMDYDPYALEYSNSRLSSYEQRVKLFLSNYKNIKCYWFGK